LLNQLSLRIRICLNEQPLLSEIRFGVVIPQGWSYDFPRSAETADLQKQIKNQGKSMQYEFSKNISKAVDHSSG